MITKELIIEAWKFLREKNHSIPDETLDFMKDVSLNAFNEKNSLDAFAKWFDSKYDFDKFKPIGNSMQDYVRLYKFTDTTP